jgi:hypothetical protein
LNAAKPALQPIGQALYRQGFYLIERKGREQEELPVVEKIPPAMPVGEISAQGSKLADVQRRKTLSRFPIESESKSGSRVERITIFEGNGYAFHGYLSTKVIFAPQRR